MTKRDLDSAIFALSSLISEALAGRNRHKGRVAEMHLDVTDALHRVLAHRETELRQMAQEIRDLWRQIDILKRKAAGGGDDPQGGGEVGEM